MADVAAVQDNRIYSVPIQAHDEAQESKQAHSKDSTMFKAQEYKQKQHLNPWDLTLSNTIIHLSVWKKKNH